MFPEQFPGRGKVAALKTRPETVLADVGEVMRLAGYQQALPADRDTNAQATGLTSPRSTETQYAVERRALTHGPCGRTWNFLHEAKGLRPRAPRWAVLAERVNTL